MELKLDYVPVGETSVAELLLGEVNDERSVTDLVGNASFGGAEYVLVSAQRLAPEFFDLSSGFAGTVLQKFSNYRLTLIVVGYDQSGASESLRALIAESNRGGAVLFVESREEGLARVAAAKGLDQLGGLDRGADPHVCVTCAAHYPDSAPLPAVCGICADERQYVGAGGQQWTRHSELRGAHEMRFFEYEPGLTGVGLKPGLAISQRALLVRTGEGNVLWDCVPVLTDDGYRQLTELGGVKAVAVSHPHFYSGMAMFADAFGADIYVHAADRQHVTHPHPRIEHWEGERLSLVPGVTLIRAGGHFAGGTVLHWQAGAEGKGALLTADVIGVVPDRRYVSFQYSFPNRIPLPPREVERVGAAVEPFDYDRIYGGWEGNVIAADAKEVVRRSVVRYRSAVEGRLDGAVLPWPDPPGG